MVEEMIKFTDEQEKGGRGAWFLGRFLFWGNTPRRSVISLERTREKIDNLLMFLVWLIIFAGWGAFGFWIFNNQVALMAKPVGLLFFWSKFDPLIFIFLITLWFDLFVIYRSSQTKAALNKINYRLFKTEKKKVSRGVKV